MKREIITTEDGSKTIQIIDWDEQYHSKHGAIQEANYVYLDKGLDHIISRDNAQNLSLLEIGFGTGLNAFLTLIQAELKQVLVNYVAVEAYPISKPELEQLNYAELLKQRSDAVGFKELHGCSWQESHKITDFFYLHKQRLDFSEITQKNAFDLVYYDAFGPRVQPELWTVDLFKIMFSALKSQGVLVTYCAQGNARRAMIAAGFEVEKLDGPPGKRHMLRAIKP